VSCEVIKRKDSTAFDALEWFTVDSSFTLSNKQFKVNSIGDYFLNYTSVFPIWTNLLRNNTVYKCCTLLNNQIVQCQRFLAFIYTPPSTTTTTTTTTTSSTTTPPSPVNFTPPILSRPYEYSPLFKFLERVETIFGGAKETPRDGIYRNEDHDHESSGSTSEQSRNATTDKKGWSLFWLSITHKKSIKMYLNVMVMTLFTDEISNAEIGIIVGSVAGTIIVLLIVCLGVLCYRKYRYRHLYFKDDRSGK
jgi:hypothetical protein